MQYLSIVVCPDVDVLGGLDVDAAAEAPDPELLGTVDVDRVRGGGEVQVVAGSRPHRLRYESGGDLQVCNANDVIIIQGGPSGRGQPFVDLQLGVSF